jgi:uncharacterized protein YaiE (UPF0345 family)
MKFPFKSLLVMMSIGATAAVGTSYAQDAQEATESAPIEGVQEQNAKAEVVFTPLVRCAAVKGVVEVLIPGSSEWTAVKINKYYPLGSSFRSIGANMDGAIDSAAEFKFGPKSIVAISGASEFSTKAISIGELKREMTVVSGTVKITLPRTLKDGLFSVKMPNFEVFNMAGESTFERVIDKAGDGDEVVVRVITGAVALTGRHYKIERMGVANQIRIRSTKDNLFTSLRGESGDYIVKLDQGVMEQIKDFETGEKGTVPRSLDFHLSPQCAVKIWRAKAMIGERTVISMMTFGPSGSLMNRCSYAEGRAQINSGEMVSTKNIKDVEKKEKDAESEDTVTEEAAPAEKNENAASDGE